MGRKEDAVMETLRGLWSSPYRGAVLATLGVLLLLALEIGRAHV